MANIEEVGKKSKKKFEDILNSIKKKFKEKPVFYTALGVVVIFALYKLFSSDTESEYTEEVVTDAYVPVGYDGYPYMSDSMMEDYESMLNGTTSSTITGGGTTSSGTVNNDSSSYIEDSYIYDETYYKDIISGLQSENLELFEQLEELNMDYLSDSLTFNADGDVYDGLGNLIYSKTQPYQVLTGNSASAQAQLALETADNKAWRNSVLQQMQSNSSAYSKATTQEEKDALHSANVELAKGLGLTYNKNDGKWYEADGSEALIYSNTSSKSSNTSKPVSTTTSGSKSYGGISYDANVDYAQKIKDAKASGASQSVIDSLTAQRNAKIAGEGLNADGSKKTTSSSSSSSKSSSSTSKGETNRDSGKRYSQTTTKSSGTVNPTTSSSGGVSYDKNKDYAQAIKDAKASGASQSTINKLQAQREAKIKGENLNSDGTKKK